MAQRAHNGLISLVCAPQMVRDQFWKNTFLIHFSPILDPFFGPKAANFQATLGFLMGQNPSPRTQSGPRTLDWASQMVYDHFWKHVFLTHF